MTETGIGTFLAGMLAEAALWGLWGGRAGAIGAGLVGIALVALGTRNRMEPPPNAPRRTTLEAERRRRLGS